MPKYRVEPTDSDMECGFDYTSFIGGYECPAHTENTIIEGDDFHFAHLCQRHTDTVVLLLKGLGEWE